MDDNSLFVRFGLHKDRTTLEEAKSLYRGIVVPAHILSYSQDATVAAVNHIDHDYYIDPMTYVLTSATIKNYLVEPSADFPDRKVGFKPSIKKMVENYGIYEHFEESGFKALTTVDAETLMPRFVENSIKLQLQKIDEGFAAAFKKYSTILNLSDHEHNPSFVTAPYFYFDNVQSKQWHDVNLKYARATKAKLEEDGSGLKVVPILATKTTSLTEQVATDYGDFDEIILWLNDLDESNCKNIPNHVTKLKNLAKFVKFASTNGLKVSNLYGSYFSILCTKFGLNTISNGIFYGEYKNFKTKVGGGGPPSRYYINAFHKFYSIPVTILIFQQHPELFEYEPASTRSYIKDVPSNIAEFDKKPQLAQIHFLESRKQEFENVSLNSIESLLAELKATQERYAPLPDYIIENDTLDHLSAWASALDSILEEE